MCRAVNKHQDSVDSSELKIYHLYRLADGCVTTLLTGTYSYHFSLIRKSSLDNSSYVCAYHSRLQACRTLQPVIHMTTVNSITFLLRKLPYFFLRYFLGSRFVKFFLYN